MNKKISDFDLTPIRNGNDFILFEEASTGVYKRIKISDFVSGLGGGGGGALSPWFLSDGSFPHMATNGSRIIISNSGGNNYVALPNNPAPLTEIEIVGGTTVNVNNRTYLTNVNKLRGQAVSNVSLAVNSTVVKLIYINSSFGWFDVPFGLLNAAFTAPFSNLVAWWEADNVVIANGKITEIPDKTGNAKASLKQTSAGSQGYQVLNAINNLPAIRFKDNGFYISEAVNFVPNTIFILASLRSSDDYDGFLNCRKTGANKVPSSTNNFFFTTMPGSNTTVTIGGNPTKELYIDNSSRNINDASNYNLGVFFGNAGAYHLVEVVNTAIAGTDYYVMGADSYSSYRYLDGDIVLAMILNTESPTIRQQARDWIKNKYALNI